MNFAKHTVLLVLALWAACGAAATPLKQRIDLSPALTLDAYFYPSDKASERGQAAAVVLLHGCGGAYGRDGNIGPRHALWAKTLTRAGYAVLLVDGFGGRGMREICTQANRDRTLRAADRAADAWAAKRWLAARPDIDPARIALMGWSHGGSATLYALRDTPPGEMPFAAAVAMYPGCSALAKRSEPYHPRAPLMILIGESDDWTPAESCRALAGRAPEIDLKVYPGAFHDFDNPAARLRVRDDVPNGVNPGRGVTVGPDPDAREDALRRVPAFLSERMKP